MKKFALWIAVPLAALSISCTGEYGTVANQHVINLSDHVGPRVAGTPSEAQAAQYITNSLKWVGYHPQVQSFTSTVATDSGEMTVQSANVTAERRGRSDQLLIVGAHYDSIDVGRGADDNSSGVAVILEVAARVAHTRTPYTVRFVFFGAEELGMLGSAYYVQQLSDAEKQRTIAMVNLDSILVGDYCYIYGDFGEKGQIRDWSLAWAGRRDYDLRTQTGENPDYPAGTTGLWSDHAPFVEAGIPYAYFEATNWTLGDKDGYTQVDPQYGDGGEIWHTSFDNLDYIEQTFPGRAQQHLELFTAVLHAIVTEFHVDHSE